jgi:hypothetical protein
MIDTARYYRWGAAACGHHVRDEASAIRRSSFLVMHRTGHPQLKCDRAPQLGKLPHKINA